VAGNSAVMGSGKNNPVMILDKDSMINSTMDDMKNTE
jgi:hypothetical protein